ncbi:hypothetical protein HUA74_04465 [Myxococcus sp. CA051A]|uniref:hypothetical protein n=1 Tax=Myxococcus sp. CA051A TaxID=2741739 RepID=UPI00157B0F81|nr:hypothetical protein [Myxococcus sp. CA051A]NTX59907.1 hypothetical protein [Myxococcus sp. CA051A]
MSITHDTLVEYLRNQPGLEDAVKELDDVPMQVPTHWEWIGGIHDDVLGATTSVSYRAWTHFALGFYPYNGCDLYRDTRSSRVMFSYVELGGHGARRISYLVTKHSPFIHEPVAAHLQVPPELHDDLFAALRELGMSEQTLRAQAERYKNVSNILEPLPEDRLTGASFRGERGQTQLDLTLMGPRATLRALRQRFHRS